MFGCLLRIAHFIPFFLLLPFAATAEDLVARPGWVIRSTDKAYGDLVKDLTAAVKSNGLFVVTQAGPTKAAASRGISIPGNRVIGVFNNDYAVRVLKQSTAAMIEAPIRFYVTEDADGGSTLSYKTPSFVFAPYVQNDSNALQEIADELTHRFDEIAGIAIR